MKMIVGIKLQLKLSILFFWVKFAQKAYFWSRTKKSASPLKCAYSNQSRYQISAQTGNLDFSDQICPKNGIFGRKWKNMNTTIMFCIFKLVQVPNFNATLQFWFFRPNLLQPKGYFWSKTENVNITIEFCIFELVRVPNFSLE